MMGTFATFSGLSGLSSVSREPPTVLVNLVTERLDVGGDLGLQRRGQHLPSAVTDNLIEPHRPTRWTRSPPGLP